MCVSSLHFCHVSLLWHVCTSVTAVKVQYCSPWFPFIVTATPSPQLCYLFSLSITLSFWAHYMNRTIQWVCNLFRLTFSTLPICLLIFVVRSFTFKVITDMLGLKSTIFCFLFPLLFISLISRFFPFCELIELFFLKF